MQFIKRSKRRDPRVSLVLLDWSVRESFHLLHYLSRQTVPRSSFEVIIIEYYSRVSDSLREFEDQVDTWFVLEMPDNCYYHKHLMYNAGLVLAKGDIVMIGDSDAMVKSSFIETITRAFDADPEIVYHIDQFRNMRRDFYPFNYPSFDDVLGDGCINNSDGKTTGVLNTEDPIHSRNYGACMCAKRDDLIAIGGADMHIDYLGHICGPYDMTFRLINFGRREVWDQSEFMYHTWHPGQAGADNYLGPHDGRHMSTTSLEALSSGRISPLAENAAIHLLRTSEDASPVDVLAELIPANAATEWDLSYVEANASHMRWTEYKVPLGTYKGFRITSELGRVFAYPVSERQLESSERQEAHAYEGSDERDVKSQIDKATPPMMLLTSHLAGAYSLLCLLLRVVYYRSQAIPLPLRSRAKAMLGALLAPVALTGAAIFAPAPLIGYARVAMRRTIAVKDQLAGLAIALHNVTTSCAQPQDACSHVLLIDSRQAFYFIKLVRALGKLPQLRILVARDEESVKDRLDHIKTFDESSRLIVSADLYNRFHATIAESEAAKGLVVL